ncbi:hypothetical protein H6G89_24140 [Oscillatoria sp. FACHB-1407]|uniref:hypothetical protein n=1 Tax=Oscillatoria sp. FACHB-1407 TaxID=2692847 RepID=UPI0016894D32|nr:hypothetical protein [Oscillatoria sp. FACHB-1407]MBD2464097.1 hypothetical protein [Oscillatoria sp. FACHB-1407]
MDSLQEQITILNIKVDALYQLIEQVSEKATSILTEVQSDSTTGNTPLVSGNTLGRSYSRGGYDAAMEHKDVLSDAGYSDGDSHSGERTLSPEVQIQRLTAQLTAAYNRIAALEEQLLARRIHT